jgi:hypothetical protein
MNIKYTVDANKEVINRIIFCCDELARSTIESCIVKVMFGNLSDGAHLLYNAFSSGYCPYCGEEVTTEQIFPSLSFNKDLVLEKEEDNKIFYKSGYKYQLVKDYICKTSIMPKDYIETKYISLNLDGYLIIRNGYAWDGPSGPTLDSKSSMKGALVHDALYQLLRMKLLHSSYREEIDKEFYRILLEDGMWRWRAKLWYEGVKNAASFAADPKNAKKIYIAP